MKKIFAFVTAIVSAATLSLPLAACSDEDEGVIRVYMPDGAPAVALSYFMDSGYAGTEFTVVTASVIGGLVNNGTADMAIMPINAAATSYNRGTDIVMLSVNTHGNLFVVGGAEQIEPTDLVGHSLGVIGAGNVPDLTMRMLFDELSVPYESVGLEGGAVKKLDGKVSVYYADDATGILPLLKQNKLDYALVGEPAATNSGAHIAIDMQAEWYNAFGTGYPQACLVAKGSLVRNNKAYIDGFLAALSASDGWAEQNPDKALAAVKGHMDGTSTLAALSETIVKNCNIRTVPAAEMRTACDAFFAKLTGMQTGTGTTVLSKVPDDGFYYKP